MIEVKANSNEMTVILGGDSIGVSMQANVHVTGLYEVQTKNKKISPWINSDIKTGDIIISIDDFIISSNNDINKLIENKSKVKLKIQRNNDYFTTYIDVIKNSQGKNSIGLYVKDTILGVGTLTFINPNNNYYGALGHGISSAADSGSLYASTIRSIRKALPGVAGEKNASLSSNYLGTIIKNNEIGIFGKINEITNKELIKVQKATNVHLGKAQLITVIDGSNKESFDIEIIDVNKQTSKNVKGIKIKIIDKRLLEETGGIVQGMSGSPIIQDNKLVGALSHVIISSPQIGYAVYAQWMVEEAS